MAFESALITGASSGIGAALAHALAATGTHVVLAARREEALEGVAESIAAGHGSGHTRIQVLDVADHERTEATVRELDDELRLDLVIANAGVGGGRWSGDLRWENCKPMIDVNAAGAVATLTGALPGMVERKAGQLVGISSVAQYRGLPGNAVYCATKAFLSTFLHALRLDLQRVNVGVTDVRPGLIETPMTEMMVKKPFVISADEAADIILRAVSRNRGEITFPFPAAVIGKTMAALPGFVLEPMLRRAKGS